MIVEPDFLTHWKTRALIRRLDYEAAPMCVLALWAHCQQRKTDRFHGMTPEVFAAVCAYPYTEAAPFLAAMIECGFVDQEGDVLIVHDFAKSNAQLFANWQNGMRGGRPIKNPPETHQEPIPEMGKPIDKIRLDKIGEDRSDKNPELVAALPKLKRQTVAATVPELDVCAELPASFRASGDFKSNWQEFIEHRKRKKAPLTAHAVHLIALDFQRWGLDKAIESLKGTLKTGKWTGLFEPRNGSTTTAKKPSGAGLTPEQLERIPVFRP